MRVAKAAARDAGRGTARLDPADMERLGVSVGDIVVIKGQQGSTALKVMPAPTAKRGKGQIQIDGIARENAGRDSMSNWSRSPRPKLRSR